MSTIKITQLNEKVSLDANTSNTILLGVDLPTSTTVKFTLGNLISRIVSTTGTGTVANGAFMQSNAAFLAANTPSHVANSAATYANGAFAQANAAFLVANTPTHVANSASLYANGSFIQANAAFLRANTPDAIANSAALYANGAFIQANASFIRANTPHAISNSAALYANGAFVQSNAAFLVANTGAAVNLTQNTNIGLAWSLANSSLQNTSTITVSDHLNVPGIANISGGVIINNNGLFQYNTANNTTVGQLTDKSTAVTSNGRTGQITTSSSNIAKGESIQFTVYNNQVVSTKDVIIVNIASGSSAAAYQISVDNVSVGSFNICITNNGTGPLAEALVINYAILRVN